MRTWIRDNWRWAALNLLALAALVSILRPVPKLVQFADLGPLVESAIWSVRFLLISLAITPLNTLFGWRSLIKQRKPAGLWAFAFGVMHFLLYIAEIGTDIWLQYPIPDYYAALGVIALVILAALAATSTKWAMARFGKGWKRLHRLVYAAGILGVVHGLIEATSHKYVSLYNPITWHEIVVYMVILALLLATRLPVVRRFLVNVRHRPGLAGREPR